MFATCLATGNYLTLAQNLHVAYSMLAFAYLRITPLLSERSRKVITNIVHIRYLVWCEFLQNRFQLNYLFISQGLYPHPFGFLLMVILIFSLFILFSCFSPSCHIMLVDLFSELEAQIETRDKLLEDLLAAIKVFYFILFFVQFANLNRVHVAILLCHCMVVSGVLICIYTLIF